MGVSCRIYRKRRWQIRLYDVLNPSQFAVYDLLRKTRKEIGDKTKIPLYGILSNEQLALMAQNPPKTKEDFLKIKGVNEQKPL